jgi:cell division protein FtsI (penicillin-binding protein 3)
MPSLSDRKRLALVALALFGLFSLLVIQYYRIQIVEGAKWAKRAKMQHLMVVRESPRRGVFYANSLISDAHPDKPQPLVMDVSKFHLFIDPDVIPKRAKEEIAEKVNAFLGYTGERAASLGEQFGKKSRSRKLTMWLDPEMQEEILAWWIPYAKKQKIVRNALYFVQDFKRSYPYGHLLGQVLQTVREDRNVKTGRAIPTGGLELRFQNELSGKEGKRLLMRSPRHPLDIGSVIEHPEDGADVYLTINHYLQAIAEEEIAKAVKASGGVRGWATMMDPYTGEILVCAQYPYFEPENYRKYYSSRELVEETRVRAITDCFEPGSTFKPLTVAVALLANEEALQKGKRPLFDPFEKVRSDDGRLPGRSNPMKDVGYHKYLNMYTATQKSANIYLAKLIQKVVDEYGAAWYRDVLCSVFGFGNKTGVELPSESAGLLPTPGKQYKSGRLEWSTPTPFSLAIGHNIFTNTIQMLSAYAILANGGVKVRPTLIKKIEKGGEVVYQRKEVRGERVLSESIINEVIRAMKYDTKPGGTASRADIPGYTEVGKTSTSEKIVAGKYSKTEHFSSFIGFTPLSKPRFILFVGIDEPAFRYIPGIGRTHYGGKCAAPVFREIAKRSLAYLGVPPDDPHGYPSPDPRFDPEKADWHPESKKIRELYRLWNN